MEKRISLAKEYGTSKAGKIQANTPLEHEEKIIALHLDCSLVRPTPDLSRSSGENIHAVLRYQANEKKN